MTTTLDPRIVEATMSDYPSDLIPFHEVRDAEKAARLAASMLAEGWQGAPLVAWGAELLTGVHRHAAAKGAGLETVPVVNLADYAADLFGAQAAAEMQEAFDDCADFCAITAIAHRADSDLAEALGMDIH